MFPGSRSCINLVSHVVRLLTHIDDARVYIVPYLHRRFIPRHLAPTVGLSARGFIIRWVQSSSTTTMSSSPGAVSSPRMQLMQLIKLTGSSVKVFRVCAGRLPHPGRLQHLRQPAVCIRVRVRSEPKKLGLEDFMASRRWQIWNCLFSVVRLQLKFAAGRLGSIGGRTAAYKQGHILRFNEGKKNTKAN